MLKVLHVIPNLKKGGAERICLDICNELNKRQDVEVKLILLEDSNEYQFLSKDLDLEIVNCSISYSILNKDSIDVNDLREKIINFSPDVIHSHLFMAELCVKHTELFDIPNFFHIHDNIKQLKKNNVFKFRSKTDVTRYYERHIYNRLVKKSNSTLICISKDSYDYSARNILCKRIELLSNAICIDRFANQVNRDIDSFNLITIGSLVKKKGHEFLVKVVSEIKKKSDKRVNLIIVGDGALHSNLANQIAQLNLENEVKMTGIIDFPENLLKASNLYVHGASEEPFGLVLIEAMAAGLPVVTTDGKGNVDLIRQGENGFLLQDRNVENFSRKVIECLEDQTEYERMSNYAIEFSREFDISLYVEKLIGIYQST